MSAWRHADIRSLRVLGSLPLAPPLPPPRPRRRLLLFCRDSCSARATGRHVGSWFWFPLHCGEVWQVHRPCYLDVRAVLSVTTLAEQVAAFCGTVRWTESCKLVSLEVSSGNHSGNHMYRLL
jgi:hypothetical protein